MKDIIIEKNPKKAKAKFDDLFLAREQIIKSASKDAKLYDSIKDLTNTLHPKNIEVEVTKIVEETKNVKSFYLKRKEGETLPNFEAGSYITLEIKINDRIYKRPYSISSNPKNTQEYRITIKKVPDGLVSTHVYDNCKVGDVFTISGPLGNFHYNKIRDEKDVIFLCGGTGITPILPMIYELLENQKVNSILLYYGNQKKEDILWETNLEELQTKYSNFKVKFLLTEEEIENYIYGNITEEILKKENLNGKSFFVCGPLEMYKSLNEIFKKLDIPNKYIRHEIYKEELENLLRIEHKLTIKKENQTYTISCYENETLLTSMENNHINPKAHCTVGECGFCRSKLLSGEIKTEISSLRKKDIEMKYIHPCVTYPLSDVSIELP